MQKSLKSPEYERLIALLVAVRKKADIRQQALAKKLGKPQSFVAKYEGGERRIDLIEFIAIVRAVGGDPVRLFREFVAGETPAKSARKGPAKWPLARPFPAISSLALARELRDPDGLIRATRLLRFCSTDRACGA